VVPITLKMMGINVARSGIVARIANMFFKIKGETLGLKKNFGKIGLTTNKRIRS